MLDFEEWWASLPGDWAGAILARSDALTAGDAYKALAAEIWRAARGGHDDG